MRLFVNDHLYEGSEVEIVRKLASQDLSAISPQMYKVNVRERLEVLGMSTNNLCTTSASGFIYSLVDMGLAIIERKE